MADDRHTDSALPELSPDRDEVRTNTAGTAKSIPAAAARALAEAEARRAVRDGRALQSASVPETGGRGGLDPVRYADWEIKGRAIDF